MALLTLDDPVYVVDLTPSALRACRAAFAEVGTDPIPSPQDQVGTDPIPGPIRAIALLLEVGTDPVLIAIEPTQDVASLDAAARLLLAALATGVRVRELARYDDQLCTLYTDGVLPAFVYRGFEGQVRRQLPATLLALVP